MKKLFCSFLVLASMLAVSNAMARNVSTDEAKTAAAAFMRAHTPNSELSEADLVLVHQFMNEKLGIPASYYFNVGDWGWIIIGANTATDAIIGYSECGNLDMDNLPPAMVEWVEGWSQVVADVQLLDATENYNDIDEWVILLSGNVPATKAESVILMNEKWDQGDNSGVDYNILCPVVNNKSCYTGCVATALAQIVHYYKYPVQPKNRKSYRTSRYHIQIAVDFDTVQFDYSLMPNRIVSSTTYDKRLEVSKLGYLAGVAVEMDYGPDGSSGQTNKIPGAMKSYFKYERGTILYRRASFPDEATGDGNSLPNWQDYLGYSPYNGAVNDTIWLGALRSDLLLNRPVYMDAQSKVGGSGRDAAGHAFVVCGYEEDSDERYYFNWGWGGAANGFFRLKANNMPISGQGVNYVRMQAIITGIVPQFADSTDINFGIADVQAPKTELMAAYPNPASYSVNIPYRLSSEGVLTVYTIDGRMVEQFRLPAGEDEAEIRVDKLPAGIYVYRLNGASGKFIVQ